MKKVIGYKGVYFSNVELKEALIDIQNQLLNTTFEKKHAESLSYNDLYNYFKSVAEEYNLVKDNRYIRFSTNLKVLKGTIGALIAGEIGEKRVANVLRILEMEGAKVLKNIELQPTEHDHTEIDYIVVDKSGVHMLEVKNYRNNIIITCSGEIIETGKDGITYPLSAKSHEKEYAIKQTLKNAGILFDVNYEGILVISDNRTMIVDNYKHIKICYSGNVVDGLRDNTNNILSQVDIEHISGALQEAHNPNRYLWDSIDLEQFVDDFAYLLALVERKSRDGYEQGVVNTSFQEEKSNKYFGKCIASAVGGFAAATAIFIIKALK